MAHQHATPRIARQRRRALLLTGIVLAVQGCSDDGADTLRQAAAAPIRQRPASDKIRRSKRPQITPIGDDGLFTLARTLYVDDDAHLDPAYDPLAPAGSLHRPLTTLQSAADISLPGDIVLVRDGTYDSGSTSRAVPVLTVRRSGQAGRPITFRAAPGESVVLHGQVDRTDVLVDVRARHIVIEGFELTRARRAAIVISAPASDHVTVRHCHAHHNDGDINWIGAAFRTVGPVRDIVFESCLSHNNSSGFQLRESPNQTAATAFVPPRAGNTGFAADLPESDWDAWPGWVTLAAQRVTVRGCIAFDNRLIDEHSDGFGARYAIQCVFEDNIAFGNTDDGFDLLGATRCIARRNIAFANDPEGTDNGDGNGIKIGVRGGLDNIAHHNIVFDNERGGIDMGDTERAVVVNNTAFDNHLWFGIWCEGGRSATGVTVLNNIATANPKGDIGINAGVRLDRYDYNLVSDGNDHSWSSGSGPHGLVHADPQFLDPNRPIDTAFPAGLSIPEKLAFIRAQVYAKLTLSAHSPAIDAGTPVEGITDGHAGAAPDLGAIE